MPQGLVHVLEVGGYGKVVITGIEHHVLERTVSATDVGILQTWSESVVIGAHIEEIHCTVELVVRAIDRAEAFDDVVVYHAHVVTCRHSKILVTAQVVVTCCNVELG